MQRFWADFYGLKIAVRPEPRPVVRQKQLLSEVLLVDQKFATLIVQLNDRGEPVVAYVEHISATKEFYFFQKS